MGLFGLFFLLSQVQLSSPSLLKIHFLDVGYGDAIVIQLPEGKTLLIDGGKPEDGEKIAAFLRKRGIKKINTLIITHFHKDHVGGLLPILNRFMPDGPVHDGGSRIMAPFDPTETTPEIDSVLTEIKQRSYQVIKKGDTLSLSSAVRIKILHPDKLTGDQNNDSLVMKFAHQEVSFLFAADVSLTAQEALVSAYGDRLKSDLIKIPHHANEVNTDFLNAVAPSISVLTIGPNPYNAPDPEVVALYQERGRLLRTDQHGTITVTSDGHSLQIVSERR